MSKPALSPQEANYELIDELARAGVDVNACFQCGRCSAGCPVSSFFDLTPMEVVRLASYGMEQELVTSHTIWLCAACETCSTRCPNSVDIAKTMDVLREWTLKKGYPPAEPRIPVFHRSFLNTVQRWGRVYELGMIGAYKMRSGDLFGDMKLGMQMFKKGKIHLLPHGIRGKEEVRAIFRKTRKEE